MRNNEPITSAEAGAILGVSARTVQRRAETGELEFIRKLPGPNGDYLFDRPVVERAAAQIQLEAARKLAGRVAS